LTADSRPLVSIILTQEGKIDSIRDGHDWDLNCRCCQYRCAVATLRSGFARWLFKNNDSPTVCYNGFIVIEESAWLLEQFYNVVHIQFCAIMIKNRTQGHEINKF